MLAQCMPPAITTMSTLPLPSTTAITAHVQVAPLGKPAVHPHTAVVI